VGPAEAPASGEANSRGEGLHRRDDVHEGTTVRGFQLMSPARRREVARAGGHAAQEKGSAHRWTPEEARAAGAKGGRAASRKRHAKLRDEVDER